MFDVKVVVAPRADRDRLVCPRGTRSKTSRPGPAGEEEVDLRNGSGRTRLRLEDDLDPDTVTGGGERDEVARHVLAVDAQ